MASDANDERFTAEGKFRRDPKRQRATFGVAYPSIDQRFATKTDIPRRNQQILGKRLTFTLERQTFGDVEFEECNFHYRHGEGLGQIAHLTFDRCQFRRSFMGTTRYIRCRFRHCTFTRCDFSFGEFHDCTFEECDFVQCTASDAIFERTEIDADSFMKGLAVPLYNYDQASALDLAQLSAQIDDTRFRIASRLLRSSSEVSHRFYTDAALRHLKWEELRYRHNRVQWNKPTAAVARGVALAFSTALYLLTSGGTSLLRPVVLTLAVIIAYAFLLPGDCISYRQEVLDTLGWADRTFVASSLVLGFGFTNFDACTTGAFATLVSGAGAGLVLLALLASVIVRRVYR